MSDAAVLLLALLAAPIAVVCLVALLKGYTITLILDRRRKRDQDDR